MGREARACGCCCICLGWCVSPVSDSQDPREPEVTARDSWKSCVYGSGRGKNCHLKLSLASPSQNKGRQVSGACVWPVVTAPSESLSTEPRAVRSGVPALFQSSSLSGARRQVSSVASA